MPTLTQDLIFNILALVMMPLILWANLPRVGRKSPLHAYLWREHPNLMRVALLIIALVALFAACSLLADFGLLSPAAEEATAMAIGIPFMIAALAMIGLTVAAVPKLVRAWRNRPKRS